MTTLPNILLMVCSPEKVLCLCCLVYTCPDGALQLTSNTGSAGRHNNSLKLVLVRKCREIDVLLLLAVFISDTTDTLTYIFVMEL